MTKQKKRSLGVVLAVLVLVMGLVAGLPFAALRVEAADSTGAIAITSYSVSVGNEVNYTGQLTKGMSFTLYLHVFDSRKTNILGTDPSVLAPQGRMNTTSAIQLGPDSKIITENPKEFVDSTNKTGFHYAVSLMNLTYTGTGKTVEFDLFYEGDPTLEVQKMSMTLEQLVEYVPPSSSETSSESSSAIVKGTGFVLKSVDFGGSDVNAGDSFNLDLVLLATNGTYGVENVAVAVNPSKEFSIGAGASNLYVGSVAPNKSIPITVPLIASAIVEEGSYSVTLNVNGLSAHDGSAVSAEITISVPIVQPERFEISNVQVPDVITMGMDDGFATITLVNKGKGTIYNVDVFVEGDGLSTDEGGHSFIGNMNTGTENGTDFIITAEMPGSIDARILVKYENAKGEQKELTHDFKLEVMDMGGMDPGGMDPMPIEPMPEPSGGSSLWVWIVVAVVVVGGIVTAVILIKRRKAKKAAAELEDDYEDEE